MKRCKRIVVILSVLALAAGVSAAPASAAHPVYLSLGDSWAFGFGASVPSETGYVPVLSEALQEQFDCSASGKDKPNGKCQKLELVNLAVGGATTPTLIANQLPQATAILAERNADKNPRNDVEVITLHIGGNDVTIPIIGACLNAPGSPSCFATIESELAAYRADLDAALSALREAAGPDTRILIGTYDNPFATCVLGNVPGATALAAVVLEGGTGVPLGLHDVMRDVAAQYDVEVVSVFGQLAPADWLGGSDCLHPVDSGYQKVANAFLEQLAG
jgi:lysophospholipase L1-like esterase